MDTKLPHHGRKRGRGCGRTYRQPNHHRRSAHQHRGILSAFPGRSYHRSFFFILTLLPGFVYSL